MIRVFVRVEKDRHLFCKLKLVRKDKKGKDRQVGELGKD